MMVPSAITAVSEMTIFPHRAIANGISARGARGCHAANRAFRARIHREKQA